MTTETTAEYFARMAREKEAKEAAKAEFEAECAAEFAKTAGTGTVATRKRRAYDTVMMRRALGE